MTHLQQLIQEADKATSHYTPGKYLVFTDETDAATILVGVDDIVSCEKIEVDKHDYYYNIVAKNFNDTTYNVITMGEVFLIHIG